MIVNFPSFVGAIVIMSFTDSFSATVLITLAASSSSSFVILYFILLDN
jgi:hypothetical protein